MDVSTDAPEPHLLRSRVIPGRVTCHGPDGVEAGAQAPPFNPAEEATPVCPCAGGIPEPADTPGVSLRAHPRDAEAQPGRLGQPVPEHGMATESTRRDPQAAEYRGGSVGGRRA